MSRPGTAVYPSSEAELSDVLSAAPAGALFAVTGLATRGIEFPQSPGLQLISTRQLSGITRLESADFYVTCRAGTPLAELASELKSRSLTFPFLTPSAAGTVGGMVATGQLEQKGEFYNISRWILALRIAMGSGEIIKTGAVTYKSVAGYDLPKLFCGSFGTLGVVLECSLRLYPLGARPFGKDLLPVARRLPILESSTRPVSSTSVATAISLRIKQQFDPRGVFPAISGWNSRWLIPYNR